MIQYTIKNNKIVPMSLRSKKINVLSLFDGISCGRIALEKSGFKVGKYFASEIKPHAIKCSKGNYPDIIHVGDINFVDGYDFKNISLLIGGSPCKGISRLNNKANGLRHRESRLFWEFVRILEEISPIYFLLENTPGKIDAINIISKTLRVDPISINSKLVSGQNRQRYYWTNIPNIVLPNDKNITTKDIFDYSGDIVSDSRLRWLNSESGKKSIAKKYTRINPFPKSACLTASGHKKWNENYLFADGVYRHLSRGELEKLQTLPIGYTKMLNYSEAYDCIGDGWTVDVISHIFSFIP